MVHKPTLLIKIRGADGVNWLPMHLRGQKFVIYLALSLAVIIAGVVAYIVISGDEGGGELLEREIARMEGAVAQNPGNPDMRVQLALLYYEAGSPEQAIAQLTTALEINDSHQGALVTLGDIYIERGQYEKAIVPYQKVVELNEDNPMRGISRQLQNVFYYLGVAYQKLGKFDDAIKSLEEALTIDRADADSWYIQGIVYQQVEECDKAIESFEEAVRFVPNFQEAYEGLAQCYEKTGQTTHAAYANAMISYSSGSLNEAIEQLEIVVSNAPEFAEAYLGLGLAYEKEGKIDEAISAYHEALKLKPDMWLVQAKLQALTAAQE